MAYSKSTINLGYGQASAMVSAFPVASPNV